MNDKRWHILDAYFRDNPAFLVQHHLNSYNDFVDKQIPYIIRSLNPFVTIKNDEATGALKHRIEVFVGGAEGDATLAIDIEKPSMPNAPRGHVLYPNEARLRSLTYKSNIFADILIKISTFDPASGKLTNEARKTMPHYKIGAIPTMVGSMLCNTFGMDKGQCREAGECDQDYGGYFVVSGKEKVIVAQERIATNRMFVSRSKDPKFSFEGMIRCTTEEAAIFPKTIRFYVYKKDSKVPQLEGEDAPAAAADREDDDDNEGEDATKKKAKQIKKNAIVIATPDINGNIPLFVMFRALGIVTDKSILEHIVYDTDNPRNKPLLDMLYYSIIDAHEITTQDAAMEYIMNRLTYKDISFVKYVLANNFFPNAPNFYAKALYLGHVVNTLLRVCLGIEKPTDKDNYGLKRVDVSGVLLANLFRDFYNKFRNECRNEIDRAYYHGPWKKGGEIEDIINESNQWKIFQGHLVENFMIKSLKGDWGLDAAKNGIVQDLNRLSYMGFISHMRRVNTPIDSSTKIVDPHRLHPSQWGMMCPCESPDGASIGLLKNFALLCHVSSDVPSRITRDALVSKAKYVHLIKLLPSQMMEMTKVILNNNWIGCTEDPLTFVETVKEMRRNLEVHPMTSVQWNIPNSEIYIYSDAGRVCRPLLIVNKGNTLAIGDDIIERLGKGSMHWPSLFDKNAPIEFVDVAESDSSLIATTIGDMRNPLMKYTHCEIHASTMFAVLTANIPFANHNQAPRNYFSGAQGKQAIGVYSTQFNNRMDTAGYVLHYPQRSIVNTRYMTYMRNNTLPNGENAIVAIMCYTGYNQEDSIIINKASVERGMFNLTCFKTLIEDEDTNEMTGQRIVFCNPVEVAKKGKSVKLSYKDQPAVYETLDEYGYPKLNTKIKEGTMYLGKVRISSQRAAMQEAGGGAPLLPVASADGAAGEEVLDERSAVADKTLAGIVDKVFVYTSEKGRRQCKIRLRKVRTPVLGDKHASRHAQKGTIGMILPPEDMPFTKDGVVPDLIINPHAIPTRMTIGHLIECVLGKLGSLEGEFFDATPFCGQDIESCYGALERQGYDPYGDEMMVNGVTGELIPTKVFIGPTYILRLKHMVQDKINYRVRGEAGYNQITRQPVKSRAKGGGLRVGEMENWAIYSHGMSGFIKESMMERSDRFVHKADEGRVVETPYAAKQLLHELNAMGLTTRMLFEEDKNEAEEYDFVAE
jgi:DNA-directed RNA polymerase II subunit RPB2